MLSPPAVLCGTPPAVENAHLIGRRRSHYDIHAMVRYQCSEGFFQRHIPTIRCRADGSWERPRIICAKCEFGIKSRTSAETGILLTKSLLIWYLICFWSPPITPVQTPSPQSAPWAPRPPETQRRTQGQRGRTELLLNQIILYHICKA